MTLISRLMRRRPSPVVLIASLALFVALGSTAVAGVIVTGAEVKDGSLSGRDVKDGSLGARKLSPGVQALLKSGLQGPAGVPGLDGRDGPQGVPGRDGAGAEASATGVADAGGRAGRDGVDGREGVA